LVFQVREALIGVNGAGIRYYCSTQIAIVFALNGGRAKEIRISLCVMKKRVPTPPPVDKRQIVLDAIRKGYQTWDGIISSTKLTDKQIGLIFIDLLMQKKVKVEYHSGERRYHLL
jgi:hypothetical protein